MNDEELKKIVQEEIGNNDPFWNIPIYETVKKIIDLPDGTETSITKLLNNSQFTSKQLFDIYNFVNRICRRIAISLDFSKENAKVSGLLYNLPFVVRHNQNGEQHREQEIDYFRCPYCHSRSEIEKKTYPFLYNFFPKKYSRSNRKFCKVHFICKKCNKKWIKKVTNEEDNKYYTFLF